MKRSRPTDVFGLARQALQREVDPKAVRDVLNMYFGSPAIMNARISVFASALSEVFSFSIPALGLTSEGYGDRLLANEWMPWLKNVYDWAQTHGIIPYYLIKKGKHNVPVCPPFDSGRIITLIDEEHQQEFLWFWSHANLTAAAVGPERRMRWIRTPTLPSINGELRSPLAAHLETYRSLLIMRTGMNIVNTQGPRPTHIMEQHLTGASATNDNLSMLEADFGKAAGISQKRRDEAAEMQMRIRQRQLYKSMQTDQQRNMQKSKIAPTMWTDTPQELLEEADAGFANRVIVLRPQLVYKAAAEPKMPFDYAKSEAAFNVMVSATMDKALEVITPTGGARSQNIEGATRFENERNKSLASFFANVVREALIAAYGGDMRTVMEGAHKKRMSMSGKDASEIAYLYPELDVEVNMSSASVVDNAELRLMRNDGIIDQKTMGKRIAKNTNIPEEELVALDWPSNVPRDVSVPNGPQAPKPIAPKVGGGSKKKK
jgi:hypothetical protein